MDRFGKVVSIEEFTGVKIKKVKVPKLDYQTTSSSKIELVLVYSERVLKF